MVTPSKPSSPLDPRLLPAWQALRARANLGLPHLRDLLSRPHERPAPLVAAGTGITLDLSHQAVDAQVMTLLSALAEQARVPGQREAMLRGEPINTTEHRPVLHVALRSAASASGADAPWGEVVHRQVHSELVRVCTFAREVRNGTATGATGGTFTDVVHIGIGGSDLGPRMASEALAPWCHPFQAQGPKLRVHFVSSPDAWALHSLLVGLNPHQTLVIVSSKTFTTQETLLNAAAARQWLAHHGITDELQTQHMVAVTASPSKAAAHGFAPERTFAFWDWVGGRYSIWSALGLPLALAIGPAAYLDLLAGGRAMDQHFRHTPLEGNLPVQLALMGIWNRNFLSCPTQLIATYPARLHRFAPYIQQMDMESNGKRILIDGLRSEVATGPIIWGGSGMDGQHAYFQLLHQGMHRVPVEFIGVKEDDTPTPWTAEHHRVVNLNLTAQAQALAVGRSVEDTLLALKAEGLDDAQAKAWLPHRVFEGNVPSSTIWLDRLTPFTLGALMALYEHKVFTQAAIWGINAYDQWGVELGKTMAKALDTATR